MYKIISLLNKYKERRFVKIYLQIRIIQSLLYLYNFYNLFVQNYPSCLYSFFKAKICTQFLKIKVLEWGHSPHDILQ